MFEISLEQASVHMSKTHFFYLAHWFMGHHSHGTILLDHCDIAFFSADQDLPTYDHDGEVAWVVTEFADQEWAC